MKNNRFLKVIVTSFVLILFFWPLIGVADEKHPSTVKLRIMETTDIHGYMMDYNYMEDRPTVEFGLARTAQLIKAARKEVPNSLLFDNGDLIQGSGMAHYIAKVRGLGKNEIHPIIQVLNYLNYDAATIGNHEFNYGLEFLEQTISKANFPYVNANVYNYNSDINRYNPYTIIEKKVKDKNGKESIIKIGVIGFVTTKINEWDQTNLEGKVEAKDIVETAEKFVPKMKEEGADIIIALAHTGLNEQVIDNQYDVLPLSNVKGMDAILFGHTHFVFPNASGFMDMKGVDNKNGKVNGVLAVSAGKWGNHLGVIDLTLKFIDGQWKITGAKSETRPIYKTATVLGNTIINPIVNKPDGKIINMVKEIHEETLNYLRFVSPK